MKKEYGQHFLADRNILDVIGRLAQLGRDDVVLEIGPGHGVLTRYLAERVARVRAGRDADRAARALDALEAGARGRANLMPLMVDAVEHAVTLGEICARLRAVFGVHQPSVTF